MTAVTVGHTWLAMAMSTLAVARLAVITAGGVAPLSPGTNAAPAAAFEVAYRTHAATHPGVRRTSVSREGDAAARLLFEGAVRGEDPELIRPRAKRRIKGPERRAHH